MKTKSVISFLLGIVSLVLTASTCSGGLNMPEQGSEQDSGTLTLLREQSVEGLDATVCWHSGDKVAIFDGQGTRGRLSISRDADGMDRAETGETLLKAPYTAVFPYEAAGQFSSGDHFTVHFEASQIATPDGFDPDAAIAVGRSDDASIKLYNAVSWAGFSISGGSIASARLNGPLAGEAEIFLDGDYPETVVYDAASAVSLEGTMSAGHDYYFITVPGTFRGLTLTLTGTDGLEKDYPLDGTVVLARSTAVFLGTFAAPEKDPQEDPDPGTGEDNEPVSRWPLHTARSAAAFLGSIGVNSSIEGRFEHKEQTAESMRYIGARWIRAGIQPSTAVFDYMIAQVPHIRFSMGFSPSDNDQAFAQAAYLKGRGRLIAMEGVNEPNNWAITWQGQKGGGSTSWQPVAYMQRDCYARTKTELGEDVPVWGVSETGAETDNVGLQWAVIPAGASCLLPAGTRFFDCLNVHNYFIHPAWRFPQTDQTWMAAMPTSEGKADGVYINHGRTWGRGYPGYYDADLLAARKVTTETGCTLREYKVWKNSGGGVHNAYDIATDKNSQITEELQGKLYLSCYLSQFAWGYEHTAMYILRDRTDENGNQSFGLVEPMEWEERPLHGYHQRYRKAADYLHNLTNILADDGDLASPGQLGYQLEGAGAGVHDLLLQRSDGAFCLVLWGEFYAGGGATVTVRLDAGRHLALYNPIAGTAPVQTYPEDTEAVRLTLTDHPYILICNE